MNRYDWNNPPPPGTELDSLEEDSSSQTNDKPQTSTATSQVDKRARSRSPERRRHRRKSRSRSKERRKRSRSRRRRRSRSRSRSNSRFRRKRHSRRYSRSRSRSHTKKSSKRSRSKSRSRSHRKSPKSQKSNTEKKTGGSRPDKAASELIAERDIKVEEGEEDVDQEEQESDDGPVPFKNDGSFLEMFKKMQEQQKATEEAPAATSTKPVLPAFGKRRGGKVLKTGMVAKVRQVAEEENNAQDAWSIYMKEVRKYKEVHCDDDSKTRPKMPSLASLEDMKTVQMDPRFPNTNQTRHCYQSYVDYYRCQRIRGSNYAPCDYFKKVFMAVCPIAWVEKWDDQRGEGAFAGNI